MIDPKYKVGDILEYCGKTLYLIVKLKILPYRKKDLQYKVKLWDFIDKYCFDAVIDDYSTFDIQNR